MSRLSGERFGIARTKNNGWCGYLVVRRLQTNVIMLTELPRNHGMSVTNDFEEVATRLVDSLSLSPFRTIWIEHYPKEVFNKLHPHFDLVTMDWAVKGSKMVADEPCWLRIPIEAVTSLLGRDVPTLDNYAKLEEKWKLAGKA